MDTAHERTIAAAAQCRNLERMMAALRDAMTRLALGKEGAREDVATSLLGIRSQLPIVEGLADRMAEEGMGKFKPSYRPVDRIPANEPPPGAAAQLPGSLDDMFRGTGAKGESRR